MSSAGSCLFTSVNTVTILIGQGGIVLLMRCGLCLGKQCCGSCTWVDEHAQPVQLPVGSKRTDVLELTSDEPNIAM
jgi:hypothetical protein